MTVAKNTIKYNIKQNLKNNRKEITIVIPKFNKDSIMNYYNIY